MTTEQANQLAMAIVQNERRSVSELTDQEICGYLVDAGLDETAENVLKIRNA